MRKLIFTVVGLLGFITHAHNGKIGYAIPQKIIIDGISNDWEAITNYIRIGSDFKDFGGNLKFAFDETREFLYIGFEIWDDDFSKEDVIEMYVNAGHLKKAPSNFMLKFNDGALTFFKHSAAKDSVHQNITKDHITYKVKSNLKSTFYELQIHLPGYVAPNKTIGFDILYIDVDKNKETHYHNWGTGYYGFLKEYNSGQLGDILLLDNTQLNSLSGTVKWQNESLKEAINEVNIMSSLQPELWVTAAVDSLGRYSIQLPQGKYEVRAAYKTTNPWASWGENNQFRINDTKSITVNLYENTEANLLELEIYPEPTFLMAEKGILTKQADFQPEKLDAFVNTYMSYFNIPGASIGIIKDGEIIYKKSYGVKNFLSEEKVDNKDVFQAASVTKPVFAFIANRLIDRGQLDLDKPLYKYLEFPNLKHDKRYEKMTARIVLSHQSGLPNWAWGGPQGWKNNQKADLLFTPGEQYGYSGEAFQYLGRVVEKITGKTLTQLLKKEVIEPLKIPELYFQGNEKIEMVNGHVQSYPTYYDIIDYVGVAHSLLTEAKSFSHFVNALINREGLSEGQYEAMFTTEVLINNKTNNLPYWNQGLGLGFFTQDTKIGKAVMHGGSNGDFQSEFVLFPKLRSGFVMFTNSNTGHKLGQALGRYLFYGRN